MMTSVIVMMTSVVATAAAQAQTDSAAPGTRLVRIALPEFSAAGAEERILARDITRAVTFNLASTNLEIDLVSNAIGHVDSVPRFSDWRAIKAQALVVGRVSFLGERLKTEARLWNVATGHQIWGGQFFSKPDEWQRLADMLSELLYEKLTGEQRSFP